MKKVKVIPKPHLQPKNDDKKIKKVLASFTQDLAHFTPGKLAKARAIDTSNSIKNSETSRLIPSSQND